MSGEPGRASQAGDGFLAHRWLIAVSSGVAMAEAALLVALAPAARALAPQVTALPPLAIFHDLRWLYSTHRSWLGFALLFAGLLLGRSALNTVLVRLAWPSHLAPPRALAALLSAVAVTALACLLLSPLVSLTFGVAILPFSWPFLAMLPAMLLIALPLTHSGVGRTWWRTLPPLAAAGWLLGEFAVLTLAAAVTAVLPVAGAIPLAGLAGLVNARAWYGLTATAARRAAEPVPAGPVTAEPVPAGPSLAGPVPGAGVPAGPASGTAVPAEPVPDRRLTPGRPHGRAVRCPLRRVPAAPLALAVMIALVVALTRLVFVIGNVPVAHTGYAVAWAKPDRLDGAATGAAHDPVLEIAGFGSWCCGRDRSLSRFLPGTVVQQFSYRGMNRDGQPLPYGPAAGDVPLPVLGDRIAAQVWRLHEETGQRVDIVAESEGTLGVDAMLARHPDVPIGSVVLLSPIVAPGQDRYHGASGSGLVTGDELNALIWFVGGLSPFGSSGAQTLIDSVNDVGARFFAAATARRAHVRLLEMIPLADAVTLPACPLPSSVVVVPAFHGELLGDPVALRSVRGFLRHQRVRSVPGLRTTAEIMAAAAAAWRMPEPSTPSPPCRS
jgi:hypothetical protein